MSGTLGGAEENLAAFFSDCGRIMDCRICGDPNSAMRFAFIEFMDLESAAKVGGGCGGDAGMTERGGEACAPGVDFDKWKGTACAPAGCNARRVFPHLRLRP